MVSKILFAIAFYGIVIVESLNVPNGPNLYESYKREVQRNRLKIESVRASRRISEVTLDFPQVNTSSGLVSGAKTTESNAFWEIPYAQPPIGQLRFQPPQKITTPHEHINGTSNNFLQCYQYEDVCKSVTEEQCILNMKEDCLILNVFTPSSLDLSDSSKPPSDRLPVLFYIHGGFFTINSGTQPRTDGRELANFTNTVIVTINYRLGPLGFLMHQQAGENSIGGNQGLKDQQLALEWVQENIENFGGDKTRVTIFGDSAGAQSVMFHTLSPISKNLYTNSIQQSNPAAYSFYYPSPEMSLRITNRLLQSLGCTGDERACLINSSAQHIINQTQLVQDWTAQEEGFGLYTFETYLPIIDGVEFTDWPMELYRSGNWNSEKDMIIGVTAEEFDTIMFSIPKQFNYTENIFAANVEAFGIEMARSIVDKYKEIYPPNQGEDYRVTYGKQITEYLFTCPNRHMARLAANTTSASVYYYVFDEKVLFLGCFYANGGNATGCYYSYHSADVPFVFRTVEEVSFETYTEDHLSVENQFSIYWAGFAQTGNPSSGLLNFEENFPSWPKYNTGDGSSQPWPYMYIRSQSSEVRYEFRAEICDFWDDLGYGGPFIKNVSTMETPSNSTSMFTESSSESTTSHASRLSVNTITLVTDHMIVITCYMMSRHY
uniref:crystal protein-like n=1 Tax=Styela clava TaxID=7725 RepID=UPI00193AC742|nr:crystal protein-like [Styela clava]